MSHTLLKPQTIPRAEAIDLLRAKLMELADEDTSICKLAAEKGIFCYGFHRFSDGELRERFSWIDRCAGHPTRAKLEDLANRWQIARQDVTQLRTSCDVQQREQDACGGWNDFSNEDLARFFFELTKRTVVVVTPTLIDIYANVSKMATNRQPIA